VGASVFQAGASIAIEGKTYVLLRTVEKDTWQIEESRSKRIIEHSIYNLQRMYAEGKLTFESNEVNPRTGAKADRLIVSYPPEAWRIAKIRRAYVVAIMDLASNREYLRPLIQDVWEKEQKPADVPHVSTVLRWKKKYLSSGQDISALIERSSKKGNRQGRYPKKLEEIALRAVEDV